MLILINEVRDLINFANFSMISSFVFQPSAVQTFQPHTTSTSGAKATRWRWVVASQAPSSGRWLVWVPSGMGEKSGSSAPKVCLFILKHFRVVLKYVCSLKTNWLKQSISLFMIWTTIIIVKSTNNLMLLLEIYLHCYI